MVQSFEMRNADWETAPANRAKQSQGRRSVKFEVSVVKQDGPDVESSDFKLHASNLTLSDCAKQSQWAGKQAGDWRR